MPRPLGSLRAWLRRLTVRARVAVAGVCVLALIAAGFALAGPVRDLISPPCMREGSTVVLHSGPAGECVGITDGAWTFAPGLAELGAQVRDFDRKVADGNPGDWVSVVLLLPISDSDSSVMSLTNVEEQILGALTAVSRVNATYYRGSRPKIRLLIGSDGYQAGGWSTATSVINGAASQHIVAVAGLGVSLDGTQRAITALTRDRVPVFGATLTADAYSDLKGFVRVSPANSTATRAVIRQVTHFKDAVLIHNTAASDSYSAALEKGFAKFAALPGHRIISRPPYDTTDRDRNAKSAQEVTTAEGIVRDSLSRMAQNICDAQRERPTVVLFAGRGRDLATLVRALADGCAATPVTVVSGDDVTNLPMATLRGVDWHNITVEYAGVASPGEWKNVPAGDPAVQGYRDFTAAFGRLASHPGFRGADLGDGNTMMAYDAVFTAASAIRMTGGKDLPTPRAVTSVLGALNGHDQVLGSSGPIAFSADYGNGRGSDPIDKAVPLLRLERDGDSQVITVDRPHRPAAD